MLPICYSCNSCVTQEGSTHRNYLAAIYDVGSQQCHHEPRNAEVITGGLKRGVPPVIICYHPFIVEIFHDKPSYLWKADFLYCVPAALSSPSPSLAESEMSFLRPKACELNVMRSLCLPVPEHHPDYQARHDTSPFWVGMRDALWTSCKHI